MENSVTYTRCADYYLPNISLSETSVHKPIGKYGRMRKAYLQEHRPVLWNHMILSETLYPTYGKSTKQRTEDCIR